MTQTRKLNFDMYAHPAVSRVSAYALVMDGEFCGKIISAFPTDGAGIVKCSIIAFKGALDVTGEAMKGQAGGYGYDKESAAFCDALDRSEFPDAPDLSGRGMASVISWVESLGYKVYRAC
jgi:hypothetical protein